MKYMKLDQRGAVLAEYVWIDGTNGVRSKTKVCELLLSQNLQWFKSGRDVGRGRYWFNRQSTKSWE